MMILRNGRRYFGQNAWLECRCCATFLDPLVYRTCPLCAAYYRFAEYEHWRGIARDYAAHAQPEGDDNVRFHRILTRLDVHRSPHWTDAVYACIGLRCAGDESPSRAKRLALLL